MHLMVVPFMILECVFFFFCKGQPGIPGEKGNPGLPGSVGESGHDGRTGKESMTLCSNILSLHWLTEPLSILVSIQIIISSA